MNLAILGISGGGKGTQAKLLSDKYGIVHISMGQLFRREIEGSTELGLQAASYVKQGVWVPTDLTMKVLGPVLLSAGNPGFILDGFPRLPDQPLILEQFLSDQGWKLDGIFHLVVSAEEVLRRRQKLAEKGQGFYKESRPDESQESILARFESYQRTITPILDYYRQKGILLEVDGEKTVEEIHREIVTLVEKRVLFNG